MGHDSLLRARDQVCLSMKGKQVWSKTRFPSMAESFSDHLSPTCVLHFRDLALQGLAYSRLGSTYEALGDHQQALQFLHNALSLAEATSDADAQATACSILCQVMHT